MLNTSNKYKDYYKKAKDYILNHNFESGIEYYKKCIEINNNVMCLTELANLYENLNRYEEGIEYYKKILLIEKNISKTCIITNQIGVLYSNKKDYLNAIEYFKNVLKIKNDIPDVHNNIAFCYLQLKNYKLSELNYFNSLKIKNCNNVICSLGDLFFYTKKYELSTKFYEKANDFKNNYKIKYNCSFPYLSQKKFIKGFELYENRLKTNNICNQIKEKMRVEIPQIEDWDGKKPCKKLLIVYEQGIGDNIQFYRYIIELSEKNPNMIINYFCKDIVKHIFKQYDNIHIIKNVIVCEYDYKIYIMSLPFILKINTITPNVKNYININNDKLKYWKKELSNFKKYKVGITFNGLLSSIIEKNIPLSEFSILFDNNIDLICIHKMNEISDEWKNILGNKITFLDIDKDIPFEDTIAILNNIDLLITIDTYIVHLAGILNIKTWLLLGYVSDWRWFDDENICHWYSSVEIIRMKENKELKYILPYIKEKLDNIIL